MAQSIKLRNPKTGMTKEGFVGFSWTILFFGGFPPLFRGDFIMGLVFIVLQFVTWGVSGFILAFFYNKSFTTKLIEQGYEFADSPAVVALARNKLGIFGADGSPTDANSRFVEATTTLPPSKRPSFVEGNKVCPMCAESVKRDAKICRFCRYEFSGEDFDKLVQSDVELDQWRSARLTEIVTFLRTMPAHGDATLTGDAVAEIRSLLKDIDIIVTEDRVSHVRTYSLKTEFGSKNVYSDRELATVIEQIRSET